MNVTLQIQDCTLQELQHIFARLSGTVAAAPAPVPEPAFQPKPAPAAPTEAPAPAPAAEPTPATEPVPAFQPAAATAPAATPEAPIAEPTVAPAPRRGRPSTAKQRQEQELAAVEVVGENGIREPLGKAIERLQAEKKRGGAFHCQPVAGRHDDGTIKWWPSYKDAARELGVCPEYVSQCVRECRKLRGWMLEDDNQEKGGRS